MHNIYLYIKKTLQISYTVEDLFSMRSNHEKKNDGKGVFALKTNHVRACG